MNRLALILAFACAHGITGSHELPAQQPNIVIIIGDDQSYGDFGFMGSETIETPRIDKLAAESFAFPHGYVPTSLCRPSLASIITGRYPHRHGITGNDPRPGHGREAMVTQFSRSRALPAILAEHGYLSLQSGKWWEGAPSTAGFTDAMTHGDTARGGRHGDLGLKVGREGMKVPFDFLNARAEDKRPFLLWYAPFLPHNPHNPPARLLAEYKAKTDNIRLARYWAMCEWFDETCGQLLDHLEATKLTDNTIVLFVSDNGWIQRRDAPGYAPRSKRSSNEGGVRTPILVKWPGKITAGSSEVPVSSIDLLPTILDACDVTIPQNCDGESLLPLCQGQTKTHAAVFGAAFTHDLVELGAPAKSVKSRWVVDGTDKLILHANGTAELYDLASDPNEHQDLAAKHAQRVTALRKKIEAWWPLPQIKRPNILFILTDDQRSDMLSCAGHPVLKTPTIDSLAARGVRFTEAFVTTSICAASRATFLVGLSRSSHGYTFRTPPLQRRHTTSSYPRILRSAGWRTGFFGKIGIRLEKGQAQRMFDVYKPRSPHPYHKPQPDGSTRHLTDITTDDAIAFLRSSKDQPFCISISFNAPHAEDGDPEQYFWPKSQDGAYDDDPIPEPHLADAAFFDAQPKFLRESLGRERWHWRFDSEAKRLKMTRGYYRMISGIDNAMARLLSELDTLKLRDNTIIIFTSDNGYFLGDRGLAGKWLMYEPSIRVPLIIDDPRTEREGRLEDRMALNLDIPSTIVDLCGLPVPKEWQGRSLVTLLKKQEPTWRSDFYYEHRFDHAKIPKSEGVRGLRYKYLRYLDQKPVQEELFDLKEDPQETQNLAAAPEHAARLKQMRRRCNELRDQQ